MNAPEYPGRQSPDQLTEPYATYPDGAQPPLPAPTPLYYQTATQPLAGSPAPPPAKSNGKRWLVPSLIGSGIALVLCCGGAMIAAGADPERTSEVGAASGSDPAQTPSGVPATEGTRPSDATKPPASAKAAPKPETGPKSYRIGQRVRGGDFEFIVHSVRCGISQVGDSFLNHKAQGGFCRVVVSAKNVTKKAHLFHADGTVSALDNRGREYEADGEANIYGNPDAAGFLDEINPGNSIRASVYFDVPKGTKLTKITFDAGLFTLAEDAVVSL